MLPNRGDAVAGNNRNHLLALNLPLNLAEAPCLNLHKKHEAR